MKNIVFIFLTLLFTHGDSSMNWRNNLQPGSFRGVKFYTEDHSASGGRRIALHEYPGRDEPYAEDLGRKANRFALEGYVLGDNYMAERNALIAALNQPGPGNLIHPYLGAQNVAVQNYRVTESTRNGGVATFSIDFVEAGQPLYPAASGNTVANVGTEADTAHTRAADDFAANYDTTGLQQSIIDEMQTELTATLESLETQVGNVVAPVAADIRAPFNMAARIQGAMATLKSKVTEPLRALALYSDMFEAGDNRPSVPASTPARQQQDNNNRAFHQFVQRTAVIEAARTLSLLAYTSRDDAMQASEQLMAEFDKQAEAVAPDGGAISDTVLQQLTALRIAVHNDINVRGLQLPNISVITLPATLPALVVAHGLYGDAAREADIINRNTIRHPGFVAGGQPLEVLSA